MTIVRWAAAAVTDFDKIISYISKDNQPAASRVARELLIAGDSLTLFPRRGRVGLAGGTCELLAVWPYIVVYEVDDQASEVMILRIWHAAQDRSGTVDK